MRACYPSVRQSYHLHATFPDWYGAPVLGGAKSAGVDNPMGGGE